MKWGIKPLEIINTILGMGASVIMPIVVIILGVVFRMKLKNAIRSGLTVGIGFLGVNLAIGLVSSNMGDLVAALTEQYGFQQDIVDVGWPAASGIAFGNGPFVLSCFVIFLVINVIFIVIKVTHTLNVDVFNWWHHIFVGTWSYFLTGNFVVGIVVATLFYMINNIMAERQENAIVEFGGEHFRGLSLTTQGFPGQLLVARGLDWLLDHIPGVRKINFNLGNLPPAVSFLGEPMILGVILGTGLSLIAKYTWDAALSVGVNMAGAMFLLPRMVSIMMEGLSPLTDAARDFMHERFPNRQFNIAMDYCLLIGDRDIITMGIITIPIVMILAIVLPGNKFMPFVDLTALPYWMIAPVVGTKHNSFRALIVAIIFLSISLFIATDVAPLVTQMALEVGFDVEANTIVSGFCAGWEWAGYIIHKIVEFIYNIFA